jgi:hypothetical protein
MSDAPLKPPGEPPQDEEWLVETRRVWEPIAGRKLSREEARQIRENLVGYFTVLLEWEAADRAREAEAKERDRAA